MIDATHLSCDRQATPRRHNRQSWHWSQPPIEVLVDVIIHRERWCCSLNRAVIGTVLRSVRQLFIEFRVICMRLASSYLPRFCGQSDASASLAKCSLSIITSLDDRHQSTVTENALRTGDCHNSFEKTILSLYGRISVHHATTVYSLFTNPFVFPFTGLEHVCASNINISQTF